MSHKLRKDQIRTINADKYRFSVNGKEWNDVDNMLKVCCGILMMMALN
jgi:hypothetical protein